MSTITVTMFRRIPFIAVTVLTTILILTASRPGNAIQPACANDWTAGEGFYAKPTGTDLDVFTYVPMSPGLRKADKTAEFKLIFADDVPDEARTVFQAAADIWAVLVESSVPIEVEVKWPALPLADGSSKAMVLGQAKPTAYRRDFPGAPQRDVWYPNALANKLAKKDLDPSKTDIVATFNRNAPWYFGTDGATPRGKYDLLTIVLHEFGHGLGFASSMKVQGKEAGWGIKDQQGKQTSPTIFDTFAKSQAGKRLTDTSEIPNPSADLYKELTSRKIYFGGKLAAAANGGAFPSLHAPPAFKAGASFVHLAEDKYPPGTINSLLTPSTFRAEAIHHPGPVTIGMLRDMGWGRAKADFDAE